MGQESGHDHGISARRRSCGGIRTIVTHPGSRPRLKVIHKSEPGGVRLDVVADNANAQAQAIVESVRKSVPDAHIDGMIVTLMPQRGIELLVGATRDPIFGPVVAFGSGGVMVEALSDVAFRAAPFTELEVRFQPSPRSTAPPSAPAATWR